MPEATNPFIGIVPERKMTDAELLRALRLNLAAEEEAAHLYTAHADATDNELAKKVLLEIADEERVHKGEFQRLISILSKEEDAFLAEGAEEVNAMAAGREPSGTEEAKPAATAQRTIRTIGDLRESARRDS
ncbi:MAG: Rubrerythrin [Planctomycetes bacterium]|jgi:rubrerythrin|nr:Rubrerythrin [Planctomycetota bacterium]